MPYTIHEFSTGLTIEKTTDGGWISKGDTGTWMNSTVEISQIPESITDAIRDSKFDARSISASKPAIIGRVIKGNDDKYWSVVAVIIPGKDESRLLEAYRYFWCEGKDNLCLILGWLYEQLQMPTFNPFVKSYPVTIDETTDGKYKEQAKQKTNNINNDIGLIEWLKTQFLLPIICSSSFLNSETMPLLTMDRIATAIAGGKYLVSWAYNVAALEKQEQFLLIVSSNEIAYNTFSASKPVKTYSLVAAEIASESDLNSAIQNLISLTNVQQNLIIINKIIEKLKDQDILQVEKYFTKVFDKLGAADALKHNVKDVGMLELLTLRAILLPNTLPEYLLYAGFEEKAPINLLQKILNKFFQKNNSNQIKQQSLAFQSTLYHQIQLLSNELPNIKAKLKDGLITIIEEFYKKQISRSILFWLVTEEQSLWSLCHQELANSVADDLKNIFNSLDNIIILCRQYKLQNKLQELNLNIWEKLITDYCICQNPNIYDTLRAYQFLGDLFLELGYYLLVFYFYTVSGVKVNQEILTAVREYQTEHKIDNVFGIKIPQKNSTVSGVLTIRDNTPHNRENINNKSHNWISKNIPNLQNFFIFLFSFFATILGTVILGEFLHQLIFIGLIMILIALYLSSEINKSFINKYALPLIISSIVLGHLIDNIKNVKIGNPFAIKSPDSINSASPTNSPSSSTDKTHSTTLVEENNKTFQAILDTAVNSFIKTNDAIKTIQNNILNDPELDYILSPLNPEEKKKKFLSSFKKVIGLPENYNYTKIVQDAKTNPRNIKKISTPVILAIYNYQKNNKDKIFSIDNTGRTSPVKADGIIDKVDVYVYQFSQSTMAILQNDIKQQIMN